MPRPAKTAKAPKAIASAQSLSAFVKSVCDIMRRSNCASALQYVPELTWILFLRLLDAQEAREEVEAQALGADFSPALQSPFRWQDWAAPHGAKRQQLYEAGEGALFAFINELLLPHLRDLHKGAHVTPKQRIISRIMLAADKNVRMDSETNLYDTLDRVHEISIDHIDDQHFFTLSQVYEDLLLKMGEKNSDGGQFFTPREVIRLPGGVFSTAGAGVKTNLLFFTKGQPTQRIWYYDLSWVKVGKKTPLTLAHFGFGKAGEVLDAAALPTALTADWLADKEDAGKPFPSYARLLPHRGTPEGESRYSWSVDFAARRSAAHEQALPLRDKAAGMKVAVANLKERLRQMKRERAAEADIEALEASIREQDKAARDFEAEAAAIEAAVYDLKAVNPNAAAATDERTPHDIIQSISAQGRIAADALARLAGLLATDDAAPSETVAPFHLSP